MASGGYPGSYEKGKAITGLDQIPEGVTVFHAGTTEKDGQIVTSGGRVLGVTAQGDNLRSALDLAYNGVNTIDFEGIFFRKDIAKRAINR